ncbi:MAG: tetratricopeptide repeat protein [Oscillospiraceae bacterium]|nr:tetratricopeptide repeat protein [Oscillospiraceae bacterium]
MGRLSALDWLLLGILVLLMGYLGFQLLCGVQDTKLLFKLLGLIAAYLVAVSRRFAALHKRSQAHEDMMAPLLGDAFVRSGKLRRRLTDGWYAYNADKNDRALAIAEALLPDCSTPEEYAAVYLLSGSCYKDLGRLGAAAGELRAALRHCPEDAALHVRLGRLLMDSDDPAGAEEAFRQALALDRDNAAAWANLAVVCLSPERAAEAVHAAQRSLSCDPGMTQNMSTLAVAHAMQQDGEQARAWLRRYLAADGKQGQALTATVNSLLQGRTE